MISGNALIGRLIHDNIGVVTIPITNKQVKLATDKNIDTMNDSWDKLCNQLIISDGIDIIGNMHIDTIIINGVARDFH